MYIWTMKNVYLEKAETAMKLIGDLKRKVEKAETQVEARELIKDAGMELTDEELDSVAGGCDSGFEGMRDITS